MLSILRYLRHGPLSRFDATWIWLGTIYRWAISGSGLAVSQRVGSYGPFKFDARFAFSNFDNWGVKHNGGFSDCVELSRGKSCIIDVGAHIGLVSLPVLSVMNVSGVLVAFEPSSANRKLLERHIEINGFKGRARVVGDLVGADEQDAVPFYEMSSHTGMNTIVFGSVDANYASVSRRQVSLDLYCDKHTLTPDIIKIDVEGAELGVLRGARSVLERCRPTIFLSVHPGQIELLGESLEELMQLIDSLNYVCCEMDGHAISHLASGEYLLLPKSS